MGAASSPTATGRQAGLGSWGPCACPARTGEVRPGNQAGAGPPQPPPPAHPNPPPPPRPEPRLSWMLGSITNPDPKLAALVKSGLDSTPNSVLPASRLQPHHCTPEALRPPCPALPDPQLCPPRPSSFPHPQLPPPSSPFCRYSTSSPVKVSPELPLQTQTLRLPALFSFQSLVPGTEDPQSSPAQAHAHPQTPYPAASPTPYPSPSPAEERALRPRPTLTGTSTPSGSSTSSARAWAST